MPYLGPPSNVLHRIQLPVCFNMLVALLVILDSQVQWMGIANLDFSADVVQMWRMTSFVLALLMAFRVNRVYLRWASAVQAFGGIGTAAVTLSQQAVIWVKDEALQGEVRDKERERERASGRGFGDVGWLFWGISLISCSFHQESRRCRCRAARNRSGPPHPQSPSLNSKTICLPPPLPP